MQAYLRMPSGDHADGVAWGQKAAAAFMFRGRPRDAEG